MSGIFSSATPMSTTQARKSLAASTAGSTLAVNTRMSLSSGTRKSVASRNGLDPYVPRQNTTLGVQTCKDTAVGDCPACLGARTQCHQNECQLCCEKKMCGPEFARCPFAPAIEIQTEPICEYSQVACRCQQACGITPCLIAQNCDFTGIECRCTEKSCNTSRQCIVVDEDEETCPYSSVECRCVDKGCSTVGTCIIYDDDCETPCTDFYTDEDDFYEQGNQALSPNELVARCHAICQTQIGAMAPTKQQPKYCYLESCLRKKQSKTNSACPKKSLINKFCGNSKKNNKKSPKKSSHSQSDPNLSGNETDHYAIILEENEYDLPQGSAPPYPIQAHPGKKSASQICINMAKNHMQVQKDDIRLVPEEGEVKVSGSVGSISTGTETTKSRSKKTCTNQIQSKQKLYCADSTCVCPNKACVTCQTKKVSCSKGTQQNSKLL